MLHFCFCDEAVISDYDSTQLVLHHKQSNRAYRFRRRSMEGQCQVRVLQPRKRSGGDATLPRVSGDEDSSPTVIPEESNAASTPRKAPRKKTRGNSIHIKRDFCRVFPMGAQHKGGCFIWQSRCLRLQRQSWRLAKVMFAQEIIERTIGRSERAYTERLLRRAANGITLPDMGAIPPSVSDGEETDVEAA